MYSSDEIILRKSLQEFVAQYPTKKQAARALGVSYQFLHNMLKRRQPISEETALKLGYIKIVRYERIQEPTTVES